MKRIALAVLVLLTLSGCATQRFDIAGKVENATTATQTDNSTFFVSGLGQTQTVDAVSVCGSTDKVIAVEAKQTFLNGFLGVITWGIYTPREYSVYCKR
jgi:Bor protein